MKNFLFQVGIAAALFLMQASCIKKTAVDTQVEGKTPKNAISTKRVSIITRFKNSTEDKSQSPADPASNCVVKPDQIIYIEGPAPLAANAAGYKDHVKVTLAPNTTLKNCTMKSGYFYGPHLYGKLWEQKLSDEGVRVQAQQQNQSSIDTSKPGSFSKTWAERLAVAGVDNVEDRYYDESSCYYAVSEAFKLAGIMNESDFSRLGIDGNYGESAYQFAIWAKKNPKYLRSIHLQYAPQYNANTAPRGSVVVYDRSVCGRSARHGHIEIVLKQGVSAVHYMYSSFPQYCTMWDGVSVFTPVD